jgi:hypothetical protein
MAIRFKGFSETTPVPDVDSPRVLLAEAAPASFSIMGLGLSVLAPAGLAGAITLLYLGVGRVMETEGGFVASGGPYAIVHPAPEWIGAVPLSIFALFLFGGVNLAAAGRGWGIPLTVFAWAGLFGSLGWNFLRLGFAPPQGLQGAIAWIVCGVVFWIMALGPVVPIFWAMFAGRGEPFGNQPNALTRQVWRVPRLSATATSYLMGHVAGIVAGIWGAGVLFRSLAG